ncbi:MAG: substrate-binding domain-containing protein [Oscillospiraceae bacterium]|nr:substrate-binding domain-containing protein [Oscillospiraceae bacterium]
MKKIITLVLVLMMATTLLVGCNGNNDNNPPTGNGNGGANNFDTNALIDVITREEGSGTRGAFEDVFDVDISQEADVIPSTGGVRAAVSGNVNAIGYISLGALTDEVHAVPIDGVTPSATAVRDGSYPVFRPFILAYQDGSLSDLAQDFLNFIMSAEGQAIIEGEGYIAVDYNAPAFESNGASGSITVEGSTSVAPVMHELRQAYLAINSSANIDVQEGGSGAGITGAIDGTIDLGMSSRDLRDDEIVNYTTIALDGVVIVVNPTNPITGLTMEQVYQIYAHAQTRWSAVF